MIRILAGAICIQAFMIVSALASDYAQPWLKSNHALVLDAYERNPLDWNKIVKNKKIRGFVGKASDGLPPPYRCSKQNATKQILCKKTFQNYALKQELYKTRKQIAKALGLKWGAYHLGRPGNPIEQANHFISFSNPQPDELIALDIEHDDPKKWISFSDAEVFAKHIFRRLGRYPILYTNHHTAKRIAEQRIQYPLLSRLPLWYARYRTNIRGVFPLGNWNSYALWQFSSRSNCNRNRCLMRISGTQPDIDINATGLSFDAFEKAWPFDGLVPERPVDETEQLVIASLVKENGFKQTEAPLVSLLQRHPGTKKRVSVPTSRKKAAFAPSSETDLLEQGLKGHYRFTSALEAKHPEDRYY
ncbi:MAG: glycoside hydrolase family 25 protein [Pseudomonadota bacterium]